MSMSRIFIGIITFSVLLLAGCVERSGYTESTPPSSTASEMMATVPTAPDFEPFTAQFTIFTQGTKRTFVDAMYLEQSPHAYLEAGSSSEGRVYITQPHIRWMDFFATLPFSLTTECLTTGTGQRFCSGEGGQLFFFLNGKADPHALEARIEPGDELIIRYE